MLDKTHNMTLVNSMKTFGERLRHARHRAQISQESLADKIGVTKGAVSQWENDLTQGCKNEVLFGISDVLLTDARWLATGQGEPDLTVEMPHHIALAKAIDRIPKDAREPLVSLIRAMSSAAEERFWRWAKETG